MARSQNRSAIGRAATAVSRRLANTRRGSRILDAMLADDVVAGWIGHRLGTLASNNSPPIDEAMPDRLTDGFDGLTWLFTPSPAARGISQLLLDEAAYLYRVVRALPEPRVAEIGRWKGGTTFLLAASGAHVTSLDTEGSRDHHSTSGVPAPPLRESLERALLGADLARRVELVRADATIWTVAPDSYDVVYLDIVLRSVQQTAELFELWRPGLRDGGRLIFREGGRGSRGHQAAFVAMLAGRDDVVLEPHPPGSFAVIRNA